MNKYIAVGALAAVASARNQRKAVKLQMDPDAPIDLPEPLSTELTPNEVRGWAMSRAAAYEPIMNEIGAGYASLGESVDGIL